MATWSAGNVFHKVRNDVVDNKFARLCIISQILRADRQMNPGDHTTVKSCRKALQTISQQMTGHDHWRDTEAGLHPIVPYHVFWAAVAIERFHDKGNKCMSLMDAVGLRWYYCPSDGVAVPDYWKDYDPSDKRLEKISPGFMKGTTGHGQFKLNGYGYPTDADGGPAYPSNTSNTTTPSVPVNTKKKRTVLIPDDDDIPSDLAQTDHNSVPPVQSFKPINEEKIGKKKTTTTSQKNTKTNKPADNDLDGSRPAKKGKFDPDVDDIDLQTISIATDPAFGRTMAMNPEFVRAIVQNRDFVRQLARNEDFARELAQNPALSGGAPPIYPPMPYGFPPYTAYGHQPGYGQQPGYGNPPFGQQPEQSDNKK